MRNKSISVQQNEFATYISDAGGVLIVGAIATVLLTTAAILADNVKAQTALSIGAGVVFTGTLVITGLKLKRAGRVYELIE